MDQTHQEIENRVRQSGAQSVAVAFHDMATGRELLRRPDESFHPASAFKICVMMEVFHQEQRGELSLDERLPVREAFRSIADGSAFLLFMGDDAETSLYGRIGGVESVRELVRLMITQSSNLATNLLVERVTSARVTGFMGDLGAGDLIVRRGPEDNRAYALGMNNAATARGLMRILTLLAAKAVVSPAASEAMIDILLGQRFNEGIPVGLPPRVKVAHKTGWNDRLYHDAAIVFPPDRAPGVLVVMTQGLSEDAQAPALVASIAGLLYERLTRNPPRLDALPAGAL